MYLPSYLRPQVDVSHRDLEIRRVVKPRRWPIRNEVAYLAEVLPKRNVPTSRFVGFPWYQD